MQENERLDLFLLVSHKDLSRNFIAQSIKKGLVIVNGIQILKPSSKVNQRDLITFDVEKARKLISVEDFERVDPIKMDLEIVFEDDDLLIINKPSGVATHPSHGHKANTILNGVHYYLHTQSSTVSARKHMIHRLDKDTSGLMAFAKTDKMLWWLHRQFAERNVHKEYYALVFSNKRLSPNYSTQVEGYLERSKRDRKMYLFSTKYGKWSLTDFIVEKNYRTSLEKDSKNLALMKCYPKTGRTHQIRVHLKHLDMPIWSDPIYSSEKQQNFVTRYTTQKHIQSRLFLHSHKLSFTSYNGKSYNFELPLNDDLNLILNTFDEIK
jgi:23S rRNA pseudouridine1911/1915/1917 synthase